MTGLGIISSDVNIDVRIVKSSSHASSPAADLNSSPSSSAGVDATEVREPPPSPILWSTATVMMKIAQVLQEESSAYRDVKTDFQVICFSWMQIGVGRISALTDAR